MSRRCAAAGRFPRSDILNHATKPCVVEGSSYWRNSAPPRYSWEMFARQTFLAQMPFFTVQNIPDEIYSIPAKASQHQIETSSAQVAISKQFFDRAAQVVELDADDEMTQVRPHASYTRDAKTPRALMREGQRRIPPYPNKQGELEARTLGNYTAIPLAPTWNSRSNIYTANNQYRRYSKSRLHEIEQFCHDLNDKDNAWLDDEKGGHRQPVQHDTTNRHQLSHPKQKIELAKLLVENKHKLAGPKESKECIVNWLSTIHENAQETPYYLRTGYRGDR